MIPVILPSIRPVDRATGAQPRIAKLLAMLIPAFPPGQRSALFKKQQDSCFSQL